MENVKTRALRAYERHKRIVPASAFIAGTLVEFFTLGRIDSPVRLVKQAVFLLVILSLLCIEVREGRTKIEVSHPRLLKLWGYREGTMHFLLGCLLSSFTVFYFRSSSLMGSFVFFLFIAACLVANEFAAVRKLGLALRTALFCVCFTSYLFCVVPIVVHAVGFWPFLSALLISLLSFAPVYLVLLVRFGHANVIRKQIAYPYVGVLAGFLVLYMLQILPPIPLSLSHIGIYHGVEHVPGGFKVSYLKPFWRFWESGDQAFRFRKGERIYCLFSVFSPGGFQDSVKVRWLHREADRSWQGADAVPVVIAGGHDVGWRGFSFMTSYRPGAWQVRIETADEREIGRIYVDVEPDDEVGDRDFKERVIL